MRFMIEIEIAGGSTLARPALEAALDSGVLQEAIGDYESEDGAVEVVSILITQEAFT